MINVLQLIDGGFIGGGQTHIISLCRNLDRNKFSPLIASSPYGGFKELVTESGLSFTDILLPKLYKRKILNRLNDIVNEKKIGIIHAHGGVAGMYAKFYRKKFGNIPVVHTLHGIHYIHSPNLIRRFVTRVIEQYLVNYADAYICVSGDDIKTGEENIIIIKSRTHQVANGIKLERFRNIPKDVNLMKELGIGSDKFVIGNISRFDEQKNQELLVKVFPEILSMIPNAVLLLVGGGSMKKFVELKAKNLNVQDKVIFAGSRSDVEKYYPLMDVFVFPSKWEGLSITLIEALSAGRCIVASDIPANAEMIKNNENGLLFNLDNNIQLVNIIFDLYNKTIDSKILSSNAVKSSEVYDERVMTEKIENIYSSLSGSKNV
ncbi:MAG: glycosyltransferase family 4 protein [Ignavibacteria bacterium]|nr:glycosyltransferase family 4 protein [Ignavibacteria bacterium]